MKVIHIHAKSPVDIKLDASELKQLPEKIGLTTTIQHLHKIEEVKEQLTENNKQAITGGQVLGCDALNAEKIKDKIDAFLFIGSGEFHPIKIALETKKPVFKYNPFTKSLTKINEKDIETYEKKNKASLTKFLSSDKIGILVSTKQGQNHMDKAKILANNSKGYKNKEFYIFAFDTLNTLELENFPFIECWVNTACPRIADGKPNIINISDIR